MHTDKAVSLQEPLELIEKPVRMMLDEFNQLVMDICMVLDLRTTMVGTSRLDNISSFTKDLLDMKESHFGNA